MSEVVEEYDGTLGRVLHRTTGGGPGMQLAHGDWNSGPDVLDTFGGNTEARKAWMKKQVAETPVAGEADIQPWTHVADYSVHPDSPLAVVKGTLKICMRVTAGNRLQFGAFKEVPTGRASRTQTTLARVGAGVEQLRHGTQHPVLRVACKAEAEARLLAGGKLRKGVNPKFAGVLMDCGHAKVRIKGTFKSSAGSRDYGPFYSMLPYFGHVWSYWYVIEGGVLYFIGLPLYTDNRKGTVVYTYAGKCGEDGEWKYSSKRVGVDLPPTLDDLKRDKFSAARVRDTGFTSAPPATFRNLCAELWGLGNNQFGLAGEEVDLKKLLELVSVAGPAPRIILQRALAQIVPAGNGSFVIHQMEHGDIYANLTALGFNGGVFQGVVAEQGEVTYATTLPGCGGPASSGVSGYIPSRSRYALENKAVDFAQAFRIARYGTGYFIDAKGGFRPYASYHKESDLPLYDISLTCNMTADGDYPPPPWPDPEPLPDPDPEDDDDDRKPVDLGDIGYWYESGTGVQVSHKRDKTDMGTLRYIHTITVTASLAVTKKLLYNVTVAFSVADGNSYEVVGNRVTMWYGLSYSPGVLTVSNLTSLRWEADGSWTPNVHPAPATAGTLTVWRKAYVRADFDPLSVSSDTKLQGGNIVSISSTGRTKRVHGIIQADPAAKRVKARGTMEILKVSLNPAVVEQILKNYALMHAPDESCAVAPTRVRGDVHGALAGDPVVTAGTAAARCVSARIPSGAVTPTGPLTMYASGQFGTAKAKFEVVGDFSTWYEVTTSNRQSCSISGSFEATAPATRFYMEKP